MDQSNLIGEQLAMIDSSKRELEQATSALIDSLNSTDRRTDIEKIVQKNERLLIGAVQFKSAVDLINDHYKKTQEVLNSNLVHFPASHIISSWRARIPEEAPQLTEDHIENLITNNNGLSEFAAEECEHSEIIYKESSKGFAFFYFYGVVKYHMASYGRPNVDSFFIDMDSRKEVKLTGAPLALKLRVFPHFGKLLSKIMGDVTQIQSVVNEREREIHEQVKETYYVELDDLTSRLEKVESKVWDLEGNDSNPPM